MTMDDEMFALSPPRLMITKMVRYSLYLMNYCFLNIPERMHYKILENFKSYAGIREVGPFHKCFSSVVGPNGSGKSNVIDAMLFVFGKRAKKLRLNKVSELIHKSSAVPNAQSAQVSVFFQDIIDTGNGDDDYRVIPGTETVVTRIARKDNSSTYKLNGKPCSFQIVAEYLAEKGIDLDNNRFLILQGEVEMISMMPPKGKTEHDEGLLEYLEDIIGSNAFVADTNVAAQKVELLSELRQEKLNRVKAIEQEKDSLEGAKVEAEALLQKGREIRRQQNILYQLYSFKYRGQIEDVRQSQETTEEILEKIRTDLAEFSSRVKQMEGSVSVQRREYDKIYATLQRTKEDFSAYERKDIKLREDIKLCEAQIKKLEAKIVKETEKEEDALRAIEVARDSIPKFETTILKLQENKVVEDEKLEVIFEEIKDSTDQIRSQLEAKTQELAPLQQERAVFQASLDTAQTEASLLTDTLHRNKEQLKAVETELASLDDYQAKKKQELAATEDELLVAMHKIDHLEKQDKQLEEKELVLIDQNKQLLVIISLVHFNLSILFALTCLFESSKQKKLRLHLKQREAPLDSPKQ
jgi:structural maintenance of chromosome 4